MSIRIVMRRAALALTLAGLCAGTAWAAEAQDQTRIFVRTAPGHVEKLTVDGELAPGETRALSTEAGAAATITRTDKGLDLLIAGEHFDLPMALATIETEDVRGDLGALGDLDALGDLGEPGTRHQQRIVVHTNDDKATSEDGQTANTSQRKIVIVRRAHDGEGEPTMEIETALGSAASGLEDPEAMLLSDAGAGKRVIVLRTIKHERAEIAQ